MTHHLETLRLRMEAAAAAGEFEEAAKLRDQISLLRGQPDGDDIQEIDTSRLQRQIPGKMGVRHKRAGRRASGRLEAAAKARPDDGQHPPRQTPPPLMEGAPASDANFWKTDSETSPHPRRLSGPSQ